MDNIVNDIIDNSLSLKDASNKYDISVSSIRKYIVSLKKSNELNKNKLYEDYISRKQIDKKEILKKIVENKLTVKDAALKYGCSISTIRKYIASIKDTDDIELKNLYEKYCLLALDNASIGRIEGGKKGIRHSSIDDNQIEMIYNLIVEHDYTLRQLEEVLIDKGINIKKSTLYDLLINNLSSEKVEILNDIFSRHHRFMTNDYCNDLDSGKAFNNVGTLLSKHGTSKRG